MFKQRLVLRYNSVPRSAIVGLLFVTIGKFTGKSTGKFTLRDSRKYEEAGVERTLLGYVKFQRYMKHWSVLGGTFLLNGSEGNKLIGEN